jgi:hypothetical protein
MKIEAISTKPDTNCTIIPPAHFPPKCTPCSVLLYEITKGVVLPKKLLKLLNPYVLLVLQSNYIIYLMRFLKLADCFPG